MENYGKFLWKLWKVLWKFLRVVRRIPQRMRIHKWLNYLYFKHVQTAYLLRK